MNLYILIHNKFVYLNNVNSHKYFDHLSIKNSSYQNVMMHEYLLLKVKSKFVSTLRITTVYNTTIGRSMSQLYFRLNNRNAIRHIIRHSKGKCSTNLSMFIIHTTATISYLHKIGWLNTTKRHLM